MIGIHIPWINAEVIRQEADSLRQRYWDGTIPVDAEQVATFEMGLEIVPEKHLRRSSKMDACLSGDFKTIYIDEDYYIDESMRFRRNFSFAHEIAHVVLHSHLIKGNEAGTKDEWKELVQSFGEDSYRRLEYQANEFAGRFLVPLDHLEAELELAKEEALKGGLTIESINRSAGYIATGIHRKFEVCDQTIEIRLDRENDLWPLPTD